MKRHANFLEATTFMTWRHGNFCRGVCFCVAHVFCVRRMRRTRGGDTAYAFWRCWRSRKKRTFCFEKRSIPPACRLPAAYYIPTYLPICYAAAWRMPACLSRARRVALPLPRTPALSCTFCAAPRMPPPSPPPRCCCCARAAAAYNSCIVFFYSFHYAFICVIGP